MAQSSPQSHPGAPAATEKPAATAAPPRGHLTLIGTGHVFQIRQTVMEAVAALRPALVGVELDRQRLEALLERERGVPAQAAGGWAHRKLQQFQEGIAGMYGTQTGSEMLGAVEGARYVGARILLLDGAADRFVQRVLKELTWKEKLRAGGQVTAGLARSLLWWKRQAAKQQVEAELAKYQDDPDAAMDEIRRSYPTIHRIIIQERDERMARLLREAVHKGSDTVAVVGDAHLVGMTRLLSDLSPTIYRLAAVRAGTLPRQSVLVAAGTSSSVGFRVETRPPQAP